MEFHRAMRRFGFRGPSYVLNNVYSSMDTTGDGVVGFDELFEFVRGRRHSLDPRSKKNLDLALLPCDSVPPGTTYDAIAWDAEALRVLIKRMLERGHASPADLLRKWQGGRKGLSEKEFTSLVFSSFFADEHKCDAHLWTLEVSHVVREAFGELLRAVSGAEGGSNVLQRIGIVHLQRWLDAPSVPRKSEIGTQVTEVPLKTRNQIRKQREKRAAIAAAKLAEEENERAAKANVRARAANDAIAVQARRSMEAAAEQRAKRDHEKSERVREQMALWLASRAPQKDGQRFALPPLQRWESPPELAPPKFISAPMRITIPSIQEWVHDHTKPISVPVDNTVVGLSPHMSRQASSVSVSPKAKRAPADTSSPRARMSAASAAGHLDRLLKGEGLSSGSWEMPPIAPSPPKSLNDAPKAPRPPPPIKQQLEPYSKTAVDILVSPRPTARPARQRAAFGGGGAVVLLSPRYDAKVAAAKADASSYNFEARAKTPLWALVPEVL